MKQVFAVLKGDDQTYFLEQKNAEDHAIKNGGELFQEEITEKRLNELKTQKGFFLDLPLMEVKKNDKPSKEKKPDELLKEVERLKKENEKLKKNNSLSFEEAAELYRKKADLLKQIASFNNVLNLLSTDIELKPDDKDELRTDWAEIVLNTGSYHNKRERFRINNIHVISDFIKYTSEKVNQKIEILKAEVQEL
ncbi:MAG: hypothetical protein P1P88_01230 [Bacteroidales bacterium]|nr:hypothetical protein [Bacteroidales bacterium]